MSHAMDAELMDVEQESSGETVAKADELPLEESQEDKMDIADSLAYPTPEANTPAAHDEAADEPASLPCCNEQNITTIPQIQKLYVAYQEDFSTPDASNLFRIERAKLLAVNLLEHYYPQDQGFAVRPTEFKDMAKFGWLFWLYPDECYTRPNTRRAPAVEPSRKPPLKKQPRPKFEQFSVKYHAIPAENITGFVVERTMDVNNEDGSTTQEHVPHTYLGIMMDDLETFDDWVSENLQQPSKNLVSMPRADLLSCRMGSHQADISTGIGIIMLGPRLEFYQYDREPWTEKQEEDYDEIADLEEVSSSFSRIDETNWAVDMRIQTLGDVDALFKGVCVRDVIYMDGTIGEGVKVSEGGA